MGEGCRRIRTLRFRRGGTPDAAFSGTAGCCFPARSAQLGDSRAHAQSVDSAWCDGLPRRSETTQTQTRDRVQFTTFVGGYTCKATWYIRSLRYHYLRGRCGYRQDKASPRSVFTGTQAVTSPEK